LNQVQSALTGGSYQGCPQVGDVSNNMIGYVTIDTANTCSQSLPIDASYYNTEILYDNVLTGDFVLVNPTATTGNYAAGNPMVHIRAVPEGGSAGTGATSLPNTFYSRYSTYNGALVSDRRQPLPAQFAARYIEGGAGSFNTNFLIWREGILIGADTTCGNIDLNSAFPYTEFVRFDEHENPTTQSGSCQISPCPPGQGLTEAQSLTPGDAVFPPAFSGTSDLGGWMYMNLNNPTTKVEPDPIASQNWVVVDMTAEGRYGIDFDATYLANGCTPVLGVTSTTRTPSPDTKIMPESTRTIHPAY
ncbi:MAG: hypothetical protein WBX15_01660, partial [Thermoanaerobaculia bacterium]